MTAPKERTYRPFGARRHRQGFRFGEENRGGDPMAAGGILEGTPNEPLPKYIKYG